MSGKSDLYWAVILQHRWWNWFDRAEAHLARERKKLDGNAIRRIAGEYSVARGLRLAPANAKGLTQIQIDKHKTAQAERIAEIIRPEELSGELLDRHATCEAWSSRAVEKGLTHGNQISAITKFAWFVAPDDWPVFDDRAATGLGIPPGNTRQETRSKRFYARLQALGFADKAAEARGQLHACDLSGLPSERVIDSYLMLRKSARKQSERETAGAYLASLSGPDRARLTGAAEAVSEALGRDPFGLGEA